MANDVLDRPGLRRLWDAVADRLQRNGLQPAGAVVLAGLDRDERHAIAGVLGQPVPGDRVSVDLARPRPAAARKRHGERTRCRRRGALRGPLVDRPGARQAKLNARHAVWHAGRAALDDAGLRRAVGRVVARRRPPGRRARPPPAGSSTDEAGRCRRVHPSAAVRADDPPCARGDLASRVAGDAHALDDGTVLASIVLRAVAAMTGRSTRPTPAATPRAVASRRRASPTRCPRPC